MKTINYHDKINYFAKKNLDDFVTEKWKILITDKLYKDKLYEDTIFFIKEYFDDDLIKYDYVMMELMYIAIIEENVEICQFLFTIIKDQNPFLEFRRANPPLLNFAISRFEYKKYYSMDIVECILENINDINIKDGDTEYTALHIAGSTKNVPICILKLLISKGADLKSKDSSGTTPCMSAIFHNKNIDAIRYLIDIETNLNLKDCDNQTIKDLIYDWIEDPVYKLSFLKQIRNKKYSTIYLNLLKNKNFSKLPRDMLKLIYDMLI